MFDNPGATMFNQWAFDFCMPVVNARSPAKSFHFSFWLYALLCLRVNVALPRWPYSQAQQKERLRQCRGRFCFFQKGSSHGNWTSILARAGKSFICATDVERYAVKDKQCTGCGMLTAYMTWTEYIDERNSIRWLVWIMPILLVNPVLKMRP